jgi:hypothetical protein
MSVCVYSVFVLSCVEETALRRADPPSKESYRLCKRSNGKAAKVQLRAVEPQITVFIFICHKPREDFKYTLVQFGLSLS